MEKILDYYSTASKKKSYTDAELELLGNLVCRYGESIIMQKMYWFVADKGLHIYCSCIKQFAEYAEMTDHRGLIPKSNSTYKFEYVLDPETNKYIGIKGVKEIIADI